MIRRPSFSLKKFFERVWVTTRGNPKKKALRGSPCDTTTLLVRGFGRGGLRCRSPRPVPRGSPPAKAVSTPSWTGRSPVKGSRPVRCQGVPPGSQPDREGGKTGAPSHFRPFPAERFRAALKKGERVILAATSVWLHPFRGCQFFCSRGTGTSPPPRVRWGSPALSGLPIISVK